MEKIVLHQVLPAVFAQRDDLQSDVWKKEASFQRGHLYLVEADSGQGKSTFCSYIVGYRHAYTGQVLVDDVGTMSGRVNRWVDMRMSHGGQLFQELRLFPEISA